MFISTPKLKTLQVGSGRTKPVVKEALVELTLGQRVLKIWVFVAGVRDEFIMGLDILRAYDASVDVGRLMLHQGPGCHLE
jgi:hypothetical protein